MWKPIYVMGPWAVFIVISHFGSEGPVSAANTPPAATPTDDPGDPFRMHVAPPARHELPGSFATIHFKNELARVDGRRRGAPRPGQQDSVQCAGGPRQASDTVVFAQEAHRRQASTSSRPRLRVHTPSGGARSTYLKSYKMNVSSEEVLVVPRERAVVFTIAVMPTPGANVPFDKQVDIAAHAEELPHAGDLTN